MYQWVANMPLIDAVIDAVRHDRCDTISGLLATTADVNEQKSDGTSATPLPPTAAPCAAAIDDDDDAIDDAPPSLRPLPTVHIVHASHDGFCPPSQERELSLSGATMHRVRDVHIFTERRSEEAIGRAFEALLGEAAQTRAARGQGCRQGAHVRR